MDISRIFGFACLTWAVMLTVGTIVEKGRLFIKGKERQGYVMMAALYIIGVVLVML